MDATIISILLTVFLGAVFSVISYLLVQRDKQRALDLGRVEDTIKATAKTVLDEKEKTASLVLSENRLNAALVLSERDKLAKEFKEEYKELDEKLTAHRIMIAEKYATTTLVEKIIATVATPMMKKMDEIENLLNTKVDRREFDQHRQEKVYKQ